MNGSTNEVFSFDIRQWERVVKSYVRLSVFKKKAIVQ